MEDVSTLATIVILVLAFNIPHLIIGSLRAKKDKLFKAEQEARIQAEIQGAEQRLLAELKAAEARIIAALSHTGKQTFKSIKDMEKQAGGLIADALKRGDFNTGPSIFN